MVGQDQRRSKIGWAEVAEASLLCTAPCLCALVTPVTLNLLPATGYPCGPAKLVQPGRLCPAATQQAYSPRAASCSQLLPVLPGRAYTVLSGTAVFTRCLPTSSTGCLLDYLLLTHPAITASQVWMTIHKRAIFPSLHLSPVRNRSYR